MWQYPNRHIDDQVCTPKETKLEFKVSAMDFDSWVCKNELQTQVNTWLKQSEKDSFPASMKIKLQYISYGIMVSYHIPHQQSLKWKNPKFSPPLSLPSPVVFGSGAGNTSPWLRSLWGAALGEHNEMIRWSVIVKEFAEPF